MDCMNFKYLLLLLGLQLVPVNVEAVSIKIEQGFVENNDWMQTDWLSWVCSMKNFLCKEQCMQQDKENTSHVANNASCLCENERESLNGFLDAIEAFILFDPEREVFYCLQNKHRYSLDFGADARVIIPIDKKRRKDVKKFLKQEIMWDKYFGKFLTLNITPIDGFPSCSDNGLAVNLDNYGARYDKLQKKLKKQYPGTTIKNFPQIKRISKLSSPVGFLKKSKSRDSLSQETPAIEQSHSLKRSRSAFGFRLNSKQGLFCE